MALSDPTVTINAVPTVLARTGMSLTSGVFQSSDGSLSLTVEHQSARRTRHVIRLRKTEIVADPLVPSVNQNVGYGATLSIDLPKNGVLSATAVDHVLGLVTLATEAFVEKVVGGES